MAFIQSTVIPPGTSAYAAATWTREQLLAAAMNGGGAGRIGAGTAEVTHWDVRPGLPLPGAIVADRRGRVLNGFAVPGGGVVAPGAKKQETDWRPLDEATEGRRNNGGTTRTICADGTCRRVSVANDEPPAYTVKVPEQDKPTSTKPCGMYLGPACVNGVDIVGGLKTVLGDVPEFVNRADPDQMTVNFTAGVLYHNRVADDTLEKLRSTLKQMWCTANRGNMQFVIVPAIEALLILLANVLKQQKANPNVIILGGGDAGAFDADKVSFPEGCRVVFTSSIAFNPAAQMISAADFKKVTENTESLIVAPATPFATTPGATPGSLKKLLEDLSAGESKKDMTTGVAAWTAFFAGAAPMPTCSLVFGHNN